MTIASSLLASIPSPSSGSLDLGIVELRAYGLMIGLGVIAAVMLLGKRLNERGIDPDRAADIGMWGVPFGLIGARIYHVLTDYQRFQGRWLHVFYIWEGGLGILGGVALGAAGAYYGVVRRHNLDLRDVFDAAAPTIPLAQAIGRLGNWWNQELYGRPTDLPWGLEIDAAHRVSGFEDQDTFHPTFLYEGLWNLALAGFIIWLDRKKVIARGRLFAVYVAGYSVGRLWIEALRIDSATKVAGQRINLWVFGALAIASLIVVFTGRRSPTCSEQGENENPVIAGETKTCSEQDDDHGEEE